MTLTFANAGQTTVRVPVHLGDGDLDTREVLQAARTAKAS